MSSDITIETFACMTPDEQKMWETFWEVRNNPFNKINRYIKDELTQFEEQMIKKYEIFKH